MVVVVVGQRPGRARQCSRGLVAVGVVAVGVGEAPTRALQLVVGAGSRPCRLAHLGRLVPIYVAVNNCVPDGGRSRRRQFAPTDRAT